MNRLFYKLFFLFLLFSHSLNAQLGWWTWMKGSSSTAPMPNTAPGSYGTTGVAAPTNTPPGLYEACQWTDASGKFWVYGGTNGSGYMSDLWMFDPATNNWTFIKGSGATALPVYGTQGVPAAANHPGSRAYGVSSWADASGNLWLFGGANPISPLSAYSDLWKYNIATNMWTWMKGPNTSNQAGVYGTKGVAAAANNPTARAETSANWVDNNGNLWLFGGQPFITGQLQGTFNYNYINDLWKYNPTTNEWTWMKGANTFNSAGSYGTMGTAAATNEPPARWVYSRWKDVSGNLWLLGGFTDSTSVQNDLWKYDIATNQWTWVRGSNAKNPPASYPAKCATAAGNDPPARYENRSCWTDKCNNFWMFSGNNFQNDLWHYDVPTNMWTLASGNTAASPGVVTVPAASNMPVTRMGGVPFTATNGDLWFFGGQGAFTIFRNDVWRYVIDTTCVPWCVPPAPLPVASFTAGNLSGCAPFTVNFTNTSTNSTSWDWNFGDGGTSTLQNPSHTYLLPGVYTVTLIAHNPPNHDTIVQTSYVNVFQSATAAFTSNTSPVCVGNSISFNNGSTNASSYNWNFGDGNTSTATNPSHTYGTPGNYNVTLIAVNSNGCNDTIIQPVVVKPNSLSNQNPNICTGNSFTLPDGSIVTTAGTYIDTLTAANGCDSIITTTLTVSPFVSSSQNPLICLGNTFTLPDGSIVNTAGTYIDTLTSIGGCDSIITTTLSITVISTSQNPTICAGNTFTLPDGSIVSVAGTYIDTVTTTAGCDSIVTTNLNLVSAFTTNQNPTICTGTTYTLPDGSIVSASGIYIDTLVSSGGCDSIITTTLTVTNALTTNQNPTICTGTTFTLPDGSIVNTSGIYVDTLTTTSGCDSIITTTLTVTNALTTNQNPTICTGTSFTLPDGSIVNTAGVYIDTLLTSSGCDSIITTTLTVTNSLTTNQNPTICTGTTYTLPDGSIVNTSGIYIDTLTTTSGCDSIITTTLTVSAVLTGSQNPIICAGNNFTLPGGLIVTAAGIYNDTITSTGGCDSVITTNLIVNPNAISSQFPSICLGNSYTLPGGTIVYLAGTYADTVISANGCDSIITTTLSYSPAPTAAVSADVTIAPGASATLTATGGGTYSWSPSMGLNTSTGNTVVATPTETTTYCVIVTDANGCIDTACVTVTIEIPCPNENNLAVPNAFSPNADNINDEFCLQGWVPCIESFIVTIFDRWGEKVFESNDPNFCWDGTYKGTTMDAQVFVYYIKARFINIDKAIIKKGNISLLR